MAFDHTHCAACGAAGAVHEHALVRGGSHYPSVWLCTGCLAVVAKRQPNRPRPPARPAKTRPTPPSPSSPQVDALRALPRLDGS
jgi:hypothetical protein